MFREQLLLGVSTEKLAQAIGEPTRLGAHSPVRLYPHPSPKMRPGQNTIAGIMGLVCSPFAYGHGELARATRAT